MVNVDTCRPADTEAAELVAAARKGYATHAGAESVGQVVRDVDIAGLHVRLLFRGPDVAAALAPALAHLPASGGEPDLTIHAWAGGTAPGSWIFSAGHGRNGGDSPHEVEGPHEVVGRRYLLDADGARGLFQPGFGTLAVLDDTTAQAWFWCASLATLPYWERAAPFRMLLHWWLSDHGVRLCHAAAVGTDSHGGALLVGRGGSGKSTTALLCLLDGMRYASDDYVLVATDGAPTAYSVFNSGKVDAGQLEMLPELWPAVVNADALGTEKAVVFIHDWKPELAVPGFPLRAVICPVISGRPETDWQRIPPAAALAALAPSTIFQLPGARPARDLGAMAGVARTLPAYRLGLGTDLRSIPAAVRAVIADAAAAGFSG